MKFNQLDVLIPEQDDYSESPRHSKTMYVGGGFGWSVRVRFPGKYNDKSRGDFVVETLSEGVWEDYVPFKHAHLFADLSNKLDAEPGLHTWWVNHLLAVVQGGISPGRFYPTECELPGVHLDALTTSIQALTVCEYRRFPQGDRRGGGRYLPINYMLAMMQGYWDADEASKMMRVGFPALRRLDGFIPFTHTDDPERYTLEVHKPRTLEVAEPTSAGA